MKKKCINCGTDFPINQWQKTKQYCTDICKPTFKPNYGKARGRPRKKK